MHEHSEEFGAVVRDAGGGHVDLLVDRDTMQYPSVGAHVRVVVDARPTTDTPAGCRYCGILPDQDFPRPSYFEMRTEVERLRKAIDDAERAILGDGTNEADLRLHEALSPLWQARLSGSSGGEG